VRILTFALVVGGVALKNIVVCCDGTSNEFARDRTNVVRLFYALEQRAGVQAVYYHPGVGTMEPPGALTVWERYGTRLLGLAFGYGLRADVRDAYVFLMNAYEEGDRIFLFGFSRGAYVVRAVASLVHAYGLIPPGNEPLVPYAVRNLLAVSRKKTPEAVLEALQLAGEFKDTFAAARRCSIYFVGVWDTVSSVGWIENPLHLPYTADNPGIVHGRHAVAIDERRAFFRSNLWRRSAQLAAHGPQEENQVWFAGSHCDVGGGYAESESGLSKVTLKWMLDEAAALGLLLDPARCGRVLGQSGSSLTPPNPAAPPHESLEWYWWPAELIPKKHYSWAKGRWERRMNLGRRRTIPDGSCIHASVLSQPAGYTGRLPATRVMVP
jgi:uncharacterized protein (DUF2235 family)